MIKEGICILLHVAILQESVFDSKSCQLPRFAPLGSQKSGHLPRGLDFCAARRPIGFAFDGFLILVMSFSKDCLDLGSCDWN
jgi:hypothetical protein